MRHAYGKPFGKVARVRIGQPLLSVRVRDADEESAHEAFRRAKMKFPGRQKIVTSFKWGFTKFARAEYLERLENGTVVPDGNICKYVSKRGPLNKQYGALA